MPDTTVDPSPRSEERHSQSQAHPEPERVHPHRESSVPGDVDSEADIAESPPLDPYDRLFIEQTIRGWRGVGLGGRTHVNAPVAGRDQVINILTAAERRKLTRVTISGEELDELAGVYVEPTIYEEARAILKTRHVLVLYGTASWGKHATGLRLLDDLEATPVQRLDPVDLPLLDNGSIEKGFGYLVADLDASHVGELVGFRLESMTRALRDQDGYLVLTVDSDQVRHHDLQLDHLPCDHPADATQVFVRHLSVHLDQASTDRWADEPKIRERLSRSGVKPCQAVDWATKTTEIHNEGGSVQDALARFDEHVADEVRRWFKRHEDLGECAFMTAMAVFNGGSYQDVLDAAGVLQTAFWQKEKPGEPEGRKLFLMTKDELIKLVHAESVQRREPRSFGSVVVDGVQFKEPAYQSIVFDKVWEDPVARGPVLEWLKKLAGRRRIRVQVPASLAIGRLSLANFDYVHEEVLVSWSRDPFGSRRQAVSWILAIPVRDASLEDSVRGLLHEWSSPESNTSRKLTAVDAYANLVGALSIDTTLGGLHRIAVDSEDARVTSAVCTSLTSLFDVGYPGEVLEAILDWTASLSSPSKDNELTALERTAIESFLKIAGRDEPVLRTGVPGTPRLLIAAESNADLSVRLLQLWRRALHAAELAEETGDVLERWTSRTEWKRLDLLWPFVDPFVRTDRDIRRLRCYLGMWAREPRPPFAVANRLLRKMVERRIHDAD